jgi:hypothetical protein
MSYDLPDVQEYSWGQDNFGATSVVHYIVGPKGKVGFVRDISIDITTAMAGNTAVPEIDIGISSGDATYGRYRLGTAVGTGYGVGFAEASNELITGNPPRTLADFAGHVVLDGGPTTTVGVAGGTYLTVALAGRIPASGMVVSNVTSVAAGTARLFMRDPLPYNFVAGQTINVRGVSGTFGGINRQNVTASAISVTNNTIDLTTSTLTSYTGGGVVDIVAVVTLNQATGATTTGAGYARVKIAWQGAITP